MRNIPIATRAYIVKEVIPQNGTDWCLVESKDTEESQTVRTPTVQDRLLSSPKNKKAQPDLLRHNEIIVFDTETTEGRIKNLLFAQFFIISTFNGEPIYQDVTGKNDVLKEPNLCIQKYLIVADNFKDVYEKGKPEKALKDIEAYAKRYDYIPYPTEANGSGLHFWPLSDFLNEVFIDKMVLGIPIVGFNLPFDIAHIANDVSITKDEESYQFSLLKPSVSGTHPMIKLQPLDSKKAFIKIRYPHNLSPKWLDTIKLSFNKEGSFIDLRTILFALTNLSFSLDSATSKNYYDTFHKKLETNEHGKITTKYLEYNTGDILATLDLYGATMQEYQKHIPLFQARFPIERLYSPASVGKAYFKVMGIKPFLKQNPNFDKGIIGYAMSAFYAGRSETHIKNMPIKTFHVDVHSMYPSVYVLQELWNMLIADHIETKDVTQEVISLVQATTLEDVLKKDFWKKLKVLVQIKPDNDLLPVRGFYRNAYNIGLNKLTSEVPLWYSLADIINKKLLTGKVSQIIQAIEIIPIGKQSDLQSINFFNEFTFNPYEEDFFKVVVEERTKIKKKMKQASEEEKALLDSAQLGLKILANATSYGINVELNDTMPNDKDTFKVYGFNESPTTNVELKTYEQPGFYFNPFIAGFITSGAHLILGIMQKLIEEHHGTYALMDTDSAFIVDREDISKPIGEQKGNPQHIGKQVMEALSALYPYDDNPKKALLEAEDDNFCVDKNGEPLELYVYSVASKRYATFVYKDNDLEVVEGKTHGLPYRKPLISYRNPQPFIGEDYRIIGNRYSKPWNNIFWEYLLKKEILDTDIVPHSFDFNQPVAMGYNISQISDYKLVNKRNEATDYTHRIKPFDFMLRIMTTDSSSEVIPYNAGNFIPEYFCKKHHAFATGRCRNHGQCPFAKTCLAETFLYPITPNMKSPYQKTDWVDLRTGLSLHVGSDRDLLKKDIPFQPLTFLDIAEKYLSHPEAKYDDKEGNPCNDKTIGELFPCEVKAIRIKHHGKEMSLSDEEPESVMLSDSEVVIIDSQNSKQEKMSLNSLPSVWSEVQQVINQLVKDKVVTQKTLAKEIGLGRTQLVNYLTGSRIPKKETVERLLEWIRKQNNTKYIHVGNTKPITSKEYGPKWETMRDAGNVMGANKYFGEWVHEAKQIFKEQFEELYGVKYIHVNEDIKHWKKEKTNEKKAEIEQITKNILMTGVILKEYGKVATVPYEQLKEMEVRYQKRIIAGGKTITVIEVKNQEQKIFTLPLGREYPTNRVLVKDGWLPNVKLLKKIGKKLERTSREKIILERIDWMAFKEVIKKQP